MCTEKSKVLLPTLDLHTFKYICAVIAKENRDITMVDLQCFFLQTEMEDDERILLKLTRTFALLLVEYNTRKRRKHLIRENGKWIVYVLYDKYIYSTMNVALLSFKE